MARRKRVTEQYDGEVYDGVTVGYADDTIDGRLLAAEQSGQLITKYEAVPNAVCGRIWSKIIRKPWKDHNGKEHSAAYFKLFLWSREEKYRCECRFEQSDEIFASLKKGDWVVCFGLDDLVETVKGKRFHNFRVVKLWAMPEQKGMLDWRVLFRTINQLLRGYQELTERVAALENGNSVKVPEPAPKGDKETVKKRQSVKPLVGDIYQDYGKQKSPEGVEWSI